MPPSASTADLQAALRAATEPHFVRKLDRLRLAAQHSVSQRPGNTPLSRASQATGLELANHKPYAPGDDLRYLDWNAYGRLDQRLVKTFRAEREAPLHLLLDASASMGVPAADAKLGFAAALAASLAYIALRQNNPVRTVVLGGGRAGNRVAPLIRHTQRLGELYGFLGGLAAEGPTQLDAGVEAFLQSTQTPGTVVVLSDFLVPPDAYERALDRLLDRRYHVAAVRLIGPRECDPSALPRRVRLRDVETGRERVVDLTATHRARYAAALAEHRERLRRWCTARSICCADADSGGGLDACLLSALPRAGLLR